MNELKHNNKTLLTASELSSNVEIIVANNVEQVPASGVLHGAGDELGEFIFLKIKLAVDATGINKEKIKVQVDVVPATAVLPTKTIVVPASPDQPNDSGFERYEIPLPSL